MAPDEIRTLLGVPAVLLPIRKGTKAPTPRKWQKIDYPETLKRGYQASLKRAPTIGVSLGIASGGLCTIDCDDDGFLAEILALNPVFGRTLRTTAKRGGNIWFVLNDSPPPPGRTLKRVQTAVGEFRSTGNQTIITGRHPEGADYRMVVHAPPVRIDYREIRWPDDLAPAPSPSYSSQCSPNSQSSPESQCSPTLHTLHNIGARSSAAAAARSAMACNAPLKRLYQRYIVEKRPVPRQGRRNSDLIDLVTFLHGATGRAPALELARAFWELNQDIFTDPLDQHMREAEAHLNAREQTWLATLSQDEQALAGQLIQSHREAFRICRDLASLDTHESPRGHFFLSMTDLSERISMRTVEAQRILSVFEALGCLEIATKGTRHAKGVRGIATRYRWLLPLPQ